MSTINVNLAQCDTPHLCAANGGEHVSVCAARPVPITCPIPTSFTAKVVLGECNCQHWSAPKPITHLVHCPARPIRVSCSISGKTWAESEVKDSWPDKRPAPVDGAAHPELEAACRDRWALVKALVLGQPQPDAMEMVGRWHIADLYKQRDVVFSALCEMARAESVLNAASNVAAKALGADYWRWPEEIAAANGDTNARCVVMLTLYVERLIEQVGNL